MFAMATHVFLSFSWCFASVSDICCKRFTCVWTYVANVLLGCCESRSGVAHVAMCVRSGRGFEWSLRVVWRRGSHVDARNAGLDKGVLARVWETGVQRGHPSGRPATSATVYFYIF
jgi:hypothetical protein